MPGLEHTFTARVVDVDHGETVFAVDYPQALFRRNLRKPVLNAGSSLVVRAEFFARLRAADIGWSLVAEAVHQLLEHGAEPVFAVLNFWGLSTEQVAQLLSGGVGACREAGCVLVPPRAIRAAGIPAGAAAFAVGVAEEKRVIDANRVEPGDQALGLPAGGFLPADLEAEGADLERIAQLPPARVLCRPVLHLLRAYRRKQPIHAAVVPGLGLVREQGASAVRSLGDSLEAKLMPAGVAFEPAANLTQVPPELGWQSPDPGAALAQPSCGLGLILLVAPHFAAAVRRRLKRQGVQALPLGAIVRRGPPEPRSIPETPLPPDPRS